MDRNPFLSRLGSLLCVPATVPIATDDCTCHLPGYCQAHGTYTPAVQDEEVLSTFTRRYPRSGRIVRKPLE